MILFGPRCFNGWRHTKRHPEYVPGLLVVRVREDIVQGLPEERVVNLKAIRSLSLPHAIEQPFAALRRRKVLKEVCPVFASPAREKALRHARVSVAAAFAESVRDSQDEDLRGINLLRLSQDADLERIEKELRSTRGIVYAHRVPARWAAEDKAAGGDPLRNRQWGLRAVRWFEARPLPDARGVKVGVLDTGIDARHPDLEFKKYSHEGAGGADIVGHGTHVSLIT